MRLSGILLLIPFVISMAVAPALGQSTSAVTDADTYRVGPEDVLHVEIWGRPDLTGQVTVDFSGKIQLSLVGEIPASGRTTTGLSEYLTERYQLLDPSLSDVMVSILQYNSQSVTILGAIHNPGRYGFRTIPDIWMVILEAGGATPDVDLSRVQVVRRDPEEGVSETLTVDLSAGIEEIAPDELPALRTKDTIIVPSVIEVAIPGDQFQVLGAVRSPGAYRISAAEKVIHAIALSGGALPNADLRKVRLTRPTDNGAISYQLDLRGYLYHARPMADLQLKPGDTVTIPSRRTTLSYIIDGILRIVPVITAVYTLQRITRDF